MIDDALASNATKTDPAMNASPRWPLRERGCLDQVVAGKLNKTIADRLDAQHPEPSNFRGRG